MWSRPFVRARKPFGDCEQMRLSPTARIARSSHRHRNLHSLLVRAAVGFSKTSTVPKDLVTPKATPKVSQVQWTAPLKIVHYPDPRLRAINATISVFDDSLLALAKDMIRVMYEDDGVGLAAPQVGVNVRLMVFNPYGRERPGKESILVNPEVVAVGGGRWTDQEGCLSFPGLQSPVERYRDVVVKAQDEKGQPVSLKLGGTDDSGMWLSRIFQHEYDHLQGILFHDRMRPAALAPIRPGLVELEERFSAAHPGVKIQRVGEPPAPAKASKGF
ncbi:peptide deformylase [Haematococcus lacustris]